MKLVNEKPKTNKLTDKKEMLVRILMIANVVLILVLLVLLVFKIKNKTENQKIASVGVESETEVVEKKLDDSMSSLYMSTLAGWSYKLDENTRFSFGKEGVYAGFFDKDNKDVKDGTYDISIDEESGAHMLNINYKGKTVSYEISLEDGNILLQYPGAKDPFVLSADNSEVISK